MTEKYFAGIDVGSTMTKVIVLGDSGIVSSVIGPTGAEHRRLANRVMEEAAKKAGLCFEDISYVVSTGYGRVNVPFADKQTTEISCHAKGVGHIFPEAKTIIDIGGQDSKGIKIKGGRVRDFVMNDKCAAGTGRFLEAIAETLGLGLEDLGPVSLKARGALRVSNTCTVFAEQEVVARAAEGAKLADIVAGIHEAMATRILAMVERVKIEREVVITGGGAKNVGLVAAMEKGLGFTALRPPEPLITGALGAAIIAKEKFEKADLKGEILERTKKHLDEATFFDNG
ncbi:MAG: acyl-CoA dehydratase activase [Desulfatiglans sp.]|nr:acyl-CoA dehydratase activase [Thermodesulfobacteriota bacterium]MEE4352068.1 acyl-CoA dehydratase activase [Desulfatiglans sp.]